MIRPFHRTIRRRHEPYGSPNAGKMERWLGAENLAHVSRSFSGWYGPPVPLGGVPGNVYVTAGGEFIGHIDVGNELSAEDMVEGIIQRERMKRFANVTRQRGAFSSLSALIAARTGGKGLDLVWTKTSTAPTAIGGSMDLWTCVGQPAAGAAGAAAPGGTVPTNATTGNLGYVNAVSNANTGHHLGGWVIANFVNSLLLYDRLIAVAKTINSTATEAVTGTFARYQNTTATAADYIGGNFCFPSCPTTLLAGTGHNWTVCQYTNQASTASQSFPSATGVSACALHQIDLAVGPNSWFMPLATGDVGVKALSQMQASALVATGTIDFVVGHPIGMYPVNIANIACFLDTLTTAIDQLNNVYDNACLGLLELVKPATNATTYAGKFSFCSE